MKHSVLPLDQVLDPYCLHKTELNYETEQCSLVSRLLFGFKRDKLLVEHSGLQQYKIISTRALDSAIHFLYCTKNVTVIVLYFCKRKSQ